MNQHLGFSRRFLVAVLLSCGTISAQAWDLDLGADAAVLEAFHREFAFAAYPYPGHGAVPLGLVGFEVYANVGVDQDIDDGEARDAFGSKPSGDLVLISRVGARKGLPGGFDIGASYGRALGSDLDLVSVEVQYALLDGSVVWPALSVRVTGTRSSGSNQYELDLYGAELYASKGFTVLTPYVGIGYLRAEGRFQGGPGADLSVTTDETFYYGGLTLNLLLPKFSAEVRKGDHWTGALRVGFGF